MMKKISRPKSDVTRRPTTGSLRRRSKIADVTPEDREEIDSEFDTVEIDDVVRQARNGRIEVSELDAW